jgi:WD40 repeat protein
MGKKTKRLLILGFSAAALLLLIWNSGRVNLKKLPGEILFTGAPLEGTWVNGFILYTPASGEWRTLLAGDYGYQPCWHPDKTKILSKKKRVPNSKDFPVLLEYDLSAGTTAEVLDLGAIEDLYYVSILYVPGSYNVSFVAEDKLKVLNRETGEIADLTGPLDITDYTEMAWDQTGTRFAYQSSGGRIQLYDTVTGTNQTIANGGSPVFSADGRYIAYTVNGFTRLMVYDLQTQRGWECYRSRIGGVLERYAFSPDGRHIAVWDSYRRLGGSMIGNLYIVGIHTGAKTRLLKGDLTAFVWQ